MGRTANGEGSTRLDPKTGKWECLIQSKYLNPKTGKPKRFKRVAETEQEAIENCKLAVEQWEKAFESGRDQKVDKKRTFGSYMKEYIESKECKGKLTASGYHSYIRTMNRNFYDYPIANYQLQMLNASEFQKFYDEIQKVKSHKTCLLPRQLCVRCCNWLVNQSLLKENYAEQAVLDRDIADEYDKQKDDSLKNQKKVFTPEDIEKFYYAYKNNMGQYPVVVLFLLETGMRASEFASLRNDNINLETGRIDIVETRSIRFKDSENHDKGVEEYVKVPKNKESRFVMMSDLAKECVLYMQEQTKLNCKCNTENLLYPTFRNGKRRSNSSMEVCFKELCDKLGIDRDVRLTKTGQKKGLCLHSLRHTADSIANSAKGANVVNTALAMGHKAITTENVYTHATEEGLKSITTPSQAVLEDYKKEEKSEIDKTAELYAMYLALKEKFEK